MSVPTNFYSFPASAVAIGSFLIVASGANDQIAAAAAATDNLLGTTDVLGVQAGEMASIALGGVAEVKLGGTVANGDPITSDATAKGIKGVPTNSTNIRIIGFAIQAGVAGDVIRYRIAPGILGKPSA
jgi:hypothetical protein